MRKIVSSLLLIWIYQSLCGAHRSIGRWEGSSCIADLAPPPRLKLRRRREKITSSPAVAHWGICRSDPLLGGLTGAVTCWNAPEAVASPSSFYLKSVITTSFYLDLTHTVELGQQSKLQWLIFCLSQFVMTNMVHGTIHSERVEWSSVLSGWCGSGFVQVVSEAPAAIWWAQSGSLSVMLTWIITAKSQQLIHLSAPSYGILHTLERFLWILRHTHAI